MGKVTPHLQQKKTAFESYHTHGPSSSLSKVLHLSSPLPPLSIPLPQLNFSLAPFHSGPLLAMMANAVHA